MAAWPDGWMAGKRKHTRRASTANQDTDKDSNDGLALILAKAVFIVNIDRAVLTLHPSIKSNRINLDCDLSLSPILSQTKHSRS
jgi:hypothetical protein